jgi:GTPase SAR1 family protein
MTERTVKVVVVGDPGCGKTSLITSAVSETFSRRPPPTLPETRIPANKFPENVAMMITDTSSRPEDKVLVEEAIGRADAVALCFDPQRRDTLHRVRSYWLPQLQKLNALAPILLVCCKVDDSGGGQQNEFIREVRHACRVGPWAAMSAPRWRTPAVAYSGWLQRQRTVPWFHIDPCVLNASRSRSCNATEW